MSESVQHSETKIEPTEAGPTSPIEPIYIHEEYRDRGRAGQRRFVVAALPFDYGVERRVQPS